MANDTRWIAGSYRIIRNVLGDDASRTDDAPFADICHYRYIGPGPDIRANFYSFSLTWLLSNRGIQIINPMMMRTA